MHTQILDLWAVNPSVLAGQRDAKIADLEITLTELAPIPTQDNAFGTGVSNEVPAPILDALFKGDTAAYAVLDACAFQDLPSLLERSGLPHRCLFDGDALADLGDEAPWLVQLDPECGLLRDLFTFGPAPWHLGGKPWGICLRATGKFDDVRSHLRKFTRYDRTASRGGLFRFYDPQTLDFYVHEAPPEALIGLRQGRRDVALHAFVFPRSAEAWVVARLPEPPEGAMRVAKLDREAVERVAMRAAATRIEARLRKGGRISFGALAQDQVHAILLHALEAFYTSGIKHEMFLTHLLGWAITIGPTYWINMPEVAAQIDATQAPAQQRFQAILAHMKSTFPDRVVPHYV